MENGSSKYFSQHKYSYKKNCKPPVLIAWKLKTPSNYGNMLRLANTTACAKVIFILPEGEIPADRKIKKTAQQSWSEVEHVFIHACDLMQHIPDGYTLIGVETVENSKNIFSYTLPSSLALMVGNEKHGIEPAGINLCEQTVHIPLTGKCTSLNVSHALCVALFEWVRQFVVS